MTGTEPNPSHGKEIDYSHEGIVPGGLPKVETDTSAMMSSWTDDHLTSDQMAWMKSEAKVLTELVIDRLGPQELVVDIGCGDARVRGRLGDKNFKYVGIDIDPDSVAAARANCAPFASAIVLDPMDYREGLSQLVDQNEDTLLGAVICLGNTLGTIGGDRLGHIEEMAKHANTLFVSVCENTPEIVFKRLGYYQKNSLSCKVDWERGVINSEMWGDSLSWKRGELAQTSEALRLLGFQDIEVRSVEPLGIALIARR